MGEYVTVYQLEKVCHAYAGPMINWAQHQNPLVVESKGLTFSDAKETLLQSKVHTVAAVDHNSQGYAENKTLVSIHPKDFRLLSQVVNPELFEEIDRCRVQNERLTRLVSEDAYQHRQQMQEVERVLCNARREKDDTRKELSTCQAKLEFVQLVMWAAVISAGVFGVMLIKLLP